MSDTTFYLCKIQFEIEVEPGKIKKQTRTYVVSAVSVTDAEAKIHDMLKHATEPFEVKTVSATKIEEVIF